MQIPSGRYSRIHYAGVYAQSGWPDLRLFRAPVSVPYPYLPVFRGVGRAVRLFMAPVWLAVGAVGDGACFYSFICCGAVASFERLASRAAASQVHPFYLPRLFRLFHCVAVFVSQRLLVICEERCLTTACTRPPTRSLSCFGNG